ncbi:hypothetical protein V6N12_003180 [Hibiscus sabdariffa]|uniref:Uncharacterized protein n=1 Tax=Hibiscus sabdariffa TaxID=183260 RepID=A0ABR2EB46_9ROSI
MYVEIALARWLTVVASIAYLGSQPPTNFEIPGNTRISKIGVIASSALAVTAPDENALFTWLWKNTSTNNPDDTSEFIEKLEKELEEFLEHKAGYKKTKESEPQDFADNNGYNSTLS